MFRNNRKVNKRKTKRPTKGKKKVVNTHFASQRITIPPTFLSQEIISHSVERNAVPAEECKGSKYVLKEDLNYLFNKHDGYDVNQRRSARLQQKKIEHGINKASGAADYFNEVLDENKECVEPANKEFNKDKSIFKEINKKYAEVKIQNNLVKHSLDNQNIITSHNYSEYETLNSNFSARLKEELSVTLKGNNMQLIKDAIATEFQIINDVLSGKIDPPPSPVFSDTKNDIKSKEMENEGDILNFQHIPRSQWVYTTPPRRYHAPKPTKCTIRPAVLTRMDNQVTMYEYPQRMSMDFSVPHQKQVYDSFINPVAQISFKKKFDNNFFGETSSFVNQDVNCNAEFNFGTPLFQAGTSHLGAIPTVPSKCCCAQPSGIFTKCDVMNEGGVIGFGKLDDSCSNDMEDVTIIADDGHFRLATSQPDQFKFDFGRHMFHDTPQKRFVFGNNPERNLNVF